MKKTETKAKPKIENKWHQLEIEEIKEKLDTHIAEGLTQEEAGSRLRQYGKNVFAQKKKATILDLLWSQLKSPLVVVLLLAALITLALKENVDAIVIFLALFINVLIGIFQEKRADDAFEELVKSQEKFATVMRDGEKKFIKAEELVVGDIVLLEAGNVVPADTRIIISHSFLVNESPLTGEWEDVEKQSGAISKEVTIHGQTNMAWMGTMVTKGSAEAFVVETGNNTEFGKIAKELSEDQNELIPLQKNIREISVYLSWVIFAIIVIIFVLGILRDRPLVEMLLLAISVAVAAMPEGLPAAVTVVLAVGMQMILKRGGLVRNLLAAETLGNTTFILTDKTGTITKAQMHIADILTEQSFLPIKNSKDSQEMSVKDSMSSPDKTDILEMALLTTEGYIEGEKNTLGEWVAHGGPIERAVLLACLEQGIHKDVVFEKTPRVDLLPFESKLRFVASLNQSKETSECHAYIMGAPELLLEKAEYIYSAGKEKKLTNEMRKIISSLQERESETGMRIVAVGYSGNTPLRFFDEKDEKLTEKMFDKFVFCGLIVLHDPVRDDVKESIKMAHEAGTNVVMLTGDNPKTALKIAVEVGIAEPNSKVILGSELEAMKDSELFEVLRTQKVFSRMLPGQKLRISQVLQSHGEIVAMTGDGINDAPALRVADIGIALGSGTDVAKEASDLILLDNSFSIIVAAIEEGRRIRDNIKKIIVYLISTSFSELLIIGTALIVGSPLPLLSRQILWINIIQEGFMNFAFAFEPKEDDVMKRDPRSSSMKTILTKDIKQIIVIIATVTGCFLILLYFAMLRAGLLEEKIQTVMFIATSISALFFAFSIKNLHKPIWKINIFSNKYLLYALLGSSLSLVASFAFTPLRNLLALQELASHDYLLFIAFGFFNLIVIEIAKYLTFKRK